MADQNFSPLPAPVTPDPRVAVERRQRELREGIDALGKAIVEHRAAGRFASASADEALVKELRRKLASLTLFGVEDVREAAAPPGGSAAAGP